MVYSYLKKIYELLFKKKTSTIYERNLTRVTQASREGERIVFVSSYPRSGNTWIRYLISDCFIQNMGLKTETKLPIHPDAVIPDLACNAVDERDTFVKTPGLFVKTHDSFEVALRFLDSAGHNNMRHICVYRSPEDALVSYYHFHRRYESLASQTSGGIDAFCLARIDDWKSHLESYIEAKYKFDGSIFFVSYESMLSNAEVVLSSLFLWLDIPMEDIVLQRAVSNMSFKNFRADEEKNPINKEEFFFRRGMSGTGNEELQRSTLDVISMKTSDLLRKADMFLAQQDVKTTL